LHAKGGRKFLVRINNARKIIDEEIGPKIFNQHRGGKFLVGAFLTCTKFFAENILRRTFPF
jgi:hypothetical protein